MEQNAIVILTGGSEAKTKFNEIAREAGYWIWNINPHNVLGVATRSMGWNGKRTDRYYEFISKLSELANDYWNFDEKYVVDMVNKFNGSDKANLLVVHHCNLDLADKLVDEYGALTIHVDSKEGAVICDKFILYDEYFRENVMSLLRILIS